MPNKNEEKIEAEVIRESHREHINRRDDGRVFWGLLLIIIGGMFFVQSYFGINVWTNFWPIILIFIGLLLLIKSKR